MTLGTFTPTLSLLLIPLLAAPPGWSQAAGAAGGSPTGALQLKVVDSDGPQVAVNSRGGRGFSILVTDGSGSGVPEAAVAVRLPDSGASGLFADGSHSAVVYTDANGRAHLEGILWNGTPGPMSIRITATKGDEHAGLLLDGALVASGSERKATPEPVTAAAEKVREEKVTAPRLEAAAVTVAKAAPAAEEAAPLNTIAPGEAVPVRPAIRASAPVSESAVLRAPTEPSVLISNDGTGPAYHGSSSKKKWVLIGLAIAAGAGAAFAVASMSKSGSTAASSSSISIGAPTVSVGHP